MDGANLISGTFTTPSAIPDTNWKLVATGDFNRDGKTDFLWRHAVSGQNVVWYMDGVTLISGTFMTPEALTDLNWKVAGTGDVNLDGKTDILWRHATSGQIVVWYLDGVTLNVGTFLDPPALPDLSWQAQVTRDFNVDGKTDIVWRHATSGEIVVWRLDGATLTTGTFTIPSALADVNWKIVGPR